MSYVGEHQQRVLTRARKRLEPCLAATRHKASQMTGVVHSLPLARNLHRAFKVLESDPTYRLTLASLVRRAADVGVQAEIHELIHEHLLKGRSIAELTANCTDNDHDFLTGGDDILGPLVGLTRVTNDHGQRQLIVPNCNSFHTELGRLLPLLHLDIDEPLAEVCLAELGQRYIEWLLRSQPLSESRNEHLVFNLGIFTDALVSLIDHFEEVVEGVTVAFASIHRFKAYCEWFGRRSARRTIENAIEDYNERLKKKPKTKFLAESHVHEFMNEWFFREGFTPIVNFRMGSEEPDSLLEPALRHIDVGPPLLIEVKQSIARPPNNAGAAQVQTISAGQVESAVGQARSYLSKLQGAGRNVRHGAVVYFYDGERPYSGVEPSTVFEGDFRILVELIYLGEGSPHENRGVLAWRNTITEGSIVTKRRV